MSTPIATATRVRATKKYKRLVANGLTDTQALLVLGRTDVPAKSEQTEQVAVLTAPTDKPQKADKGARLVEKKGYAFTSCRVYVNMSIVEATVRVLKTGKPEIITSSGVGRTKAVLIQRMESGDVSVQNLTKP